MMVATLKIPLERRNKRTGRTESPHLGHHRPDSTDWIGEAVEAAAVDGVTFSCRSPAYVPPLLRDAYAVCRHTTEVLQSLMGHKSISSTEVYTKVFALDVAARHRVQFQMPEADAVAMLKGNI